MTCGKAIYFHWPVFVQNANHELPSEGIKALSVDHFVYIFFIIIWKEWVLKFVK